MQRIIRHLFRVPILSIFALLLMMADRAQGGLILVSSTGDFTARTTLGGDESIDWGTITDTFTTTPFDIASSGGINTTVGAVRGVFNASNPLPGDEFASGDDIRRTELSGAVDRLPGPEIDIGTSNPFAGVFAQIDLEFDSPVLAAGAGISGRGRQRFTGGGERIFDGEVTLTAFDAADNVLGEFTLAGESGSPGSASGAQFSGFAGVESDNSGSDISRIRYRVVQPLDRSSFIGARARLNLNQVDFVTSSTNVIPEPSSLALLGIGAMSLCGYGWRRRRRGQHDYDVAT